MLLKDELAVGFVKGCILGLMSLLVAILLPIAMEISTAVHVFYFDLKMALNINSTPYLSIPSDILMCVNM